MFQSLTVLEHRADLSGLLNLTKNRFSHIFTRNVCQKWFVMMSFVICMYGCSSDLE